MSFAGNDIVARLVAQDQARYSRDMGAAAASTRAVGDAADHSSGGLERATHSSERARASFGLLGGAARGASLAFGILAGVGVVQGLKFNATIEQSTVAFKNFLGSTQAASKQVQYLYKVAATTPFQFGDILNASRRLLAFGQSAKESNHWLTIIGDTVAGIGGGSAEIDRLVTAIGQIQAKGKASTEDLQQIAELGIPAFQALAKHLGISQGEVFAQLQKGTITSKQALDALEEQLAKTFGGSSAAQAKTFAGQLSTLKDNANSALGALTKPLFDLLRSSVFPTLNKYLGAFSAYLQAGGLDKIAKTLSGPFKQGLAIAGQVIHAVVDYAKQLWVALKPAQPFLQNILIPLLIGLAKGILGSVVVAFKALLVAVKILAPILGWLGEKAKPLRGVIEGIGEVIGFLVGGPVLHLLTEIPKIGFVFELLYRPIKLVGDAFGFVLKSAGRLVGGLLGPVRAAFATVLKWIDGQVGKFGKLGGRLWGALRQGFRNALGSGLGIASDIVNAVADLLNDLIPNKIGMPGPIPDIDLPDNPIPHIGGGGSTDYSGSGAPTNNPGMVPGLGGAKLKSISFARTASVNAPQSTDGGDIVLHNVMTLGPNGEDVLFKGSRRAARRQRARA